MEEKLSAARYLPLTNYFRELNAIDVSDKVEEKNKLRYLSWAWAWGEIKKLHPNATYTIYENKDGWFYHTDGKTAWVKTGVTVEGIEHIEYLPVMDFRNASIPCEKITSFDVNKAIQRSLTKAVARHGLGLYIYAGEDLPESDDELPKQPTKPKVDAKPKETLAEMSARLDAKYKDTDTGIVEPKQTTTPTPTVDTDSLPFNEGDNRISKQKLDYITGIVRTLSVERVMKFNEWLEKTYKVRSVNELTDSQATSVIAQLTKTKV